MMKQLALDIGLSAGPGLANFCAGPNLAALRHLELWVGPTASTGSANRSPVPTYLWGPSGSGKSHLLKAAREALREQGARVGWLDASVPDAPEFNESWAAVMLDDVHLYTAAQQHMAFNWFVNAQTLQRPVLAAGEFAPVVLKLRDDLRTRLGWGLIYQVIGLSDDDKIDALERAAQAKGIGLAQGVLPYLITHYRRDMRSLTSMLGELDHYSLETKRPITLPLLRELLQRDHAE